MRVLFHAVAVRQVGGATRLITALAQGLRSVAPDCEATFLLHKELDVELPPDTGVLRVGIRGALGRAFFDTLRWKSYVYPQRPDVLVLLFGFGPRSPSVPTLVFLSDATYTCPFSRVGRTASERIQVSVRASLLRASVRSASRVVAPSEALARAAASSFGLGTPVKVMRLPWDRGWREPAETRPAYGPSRPLELLYVSQLQPHKAHWTLPPILAAIRKRGIEARLTVAIDQRDSPRLWKAFHAEVARAGLAPWVTVLSDQSDDQIARLYSEADVFLFPSVCESFGYPMVEATAAGLPVVAADTPVNREILGSGGFFYPVGDVAAAADAIEVLALHPSTRSAAVRSAIGHQRSIVPSSTEFAEQFHEQLVEVAGSRTTAHARTS